MRFHAAPGPDNGFLHYFIGMAVATFAPGRIWMFRMPFGFGDSFDGGFLPTFISMQFYAAYQPWHW